MTRQSSNSLAPGFRFHPTDEELVRYYLNRKVSGKPLRFNPISEIDIYKSEPWDLPDKSKLKSRDLEWYFFSALDRKYGNGSKTNRATEKGYWKTTGKDRVVKNGPKTVGMKKTLVYHCGRAPRGERTNWVMHEYRLEDEESEKAGITQDAFVLCRVFKKSGSGPKNGEQYGAPFVEEEWEEDDEIGLFPGQEFFTDEVGNTEGVHDRSNDMDQNFDAGTGSANNSYEANFNPIESSNSVENSVEIDGCDVKPPSLCIDGIAFDVQQQDEQNLQEQFTLNARSFGNNQYVDGLNPEDIEYLLNGHFFDASDDPSFGLEANDLLDDTQSDAGEINVEDYLTFFDVDDDNFLNYGPSELVVNENPSAEAVFTKEPMNHGTELAPAASQQLMESLGEQEGSTSKHQPVVKDAEPMKDMKYSLMRKASSLLESFPAPPAFASEFPAKDALIKLGSSAQDSSSVAGFIKIRDMTSSANAMDWSFGKNGELNIVLSIGLPQSNASNFGPVSSLFSGKMPSTVSRSWLYIFFFWVLILSVGIKVGIAVCIS